VGLLSVNSLLMLVAGLGVGVAAAFTGLGGGFLMVPLLLYMGHTSQQAVGTSFLAILPIAFSAVIAHNKLHNVDYRVGLLLAAGGIIGAQYGARLLEGVSNVTFNRLFGAILVALGVKMLLQR